MMTELTHLPVIDWELGLKLAGNKIELAEEMLELFIGNLSKELSTIKHHYFEQNYKELLRHVHRVHGALCYCGLPRLKTVITKLETELKNNIIMSLPSLLNQLDTEVNLLLEYHSHLNT